ncbi:MAG TPA: MBL fold metallo-hydrolase [Bacteroidota bacterium]|nr:MBL fold metallo-hydrolase [Bacteroidota bacterium]
MKSEVIFDDGTHKWIVMGRDNTKKEKVIDTNEYVIIDNSEAMLLDPGGIEIFPAVLTELTKFVEINKIRSIFASHQDPDISSSLAMWLDLVPNVNIYAPWIWIGFISHFGMGTDFKLNPIPDEGMELRVGNISVYCVPAHFCHSAGNFSLFDPKANILFSGDIGAGLVPDNYPLIVDNFNEHTQYMEGFHKRWMPSSIYLKAWIKRVRALNPSIIAPQHGSIFMGDNVEKFLNWLDTFEVGVINLGNESSDFNNSIWMKWKK